MADVTEFANLPGVFVELIDQGLAVFEQNKAPRTLILGTATQGQTERPYIVTSSSTAASEFGSSGTLTRGMYEVKTTGAENVLLYRIGSTAATLAGIGCTAGTGGYTVETVRKDSDAGSIYSIWYSDGIDRLVVWNTSTGLVVYDNDATDPLDLGEVIVSGSRCTGGGADIGGPSTGSNLEDVTATGTTYTAGTDGASPSRMELYEYLYKAYKDLLGEDFDHVIPMDVYLDDKNIVDGDAFTAAYIASIVNGQTYPTAASDDDILGKIFVEEYQGEYYFFWDLNGDGDAEIWPNGTGYASATTKISGASLTTADFHEVNYGYQLARWCHEVSTNNVECLGSIGVLPPANLSRASITAWIGKLPTYTTRSDGTQYINNISENGTGLLGNKWKAGKWGFRSGSPAYGGFINTDTEWRDGTEQTDQNDQYIDIGRYISVVAAYLRFFNPIDTSGWGYAATAAPTYMGYVSTLDEKDAPTNNILRSAQALFTVSPRFVDRLTQTGYVYVYEKPKGLVISDSPTGARPLSDYRRLTTMRIVKRVIDTFRARADPFIGKSSNAANQAALETGINQGLSNLVSGGYLTRFELSIRQTAIQRVIGEASAELVIVPAWELRRIRLTLSLKPE
jgi:hypothetical protein